MKFITLENTAEEEAIAMGKKYRLKVLQGRKSRKKVYFLGCWTEPMMGTIYKPGQDGKNIRKRLPKITLNEEKNE